MLLLFKYLVIAFVVLLILFLLLNFFIKKRWGKILGYKPTLKEINVITDLESVKYPQDKIVEILKNFNSGLIDKNTIKELIKNKKQEIKQQTEYELVAKNREREQPNINNDVKVEVTLNVEYGLIEKSDTDHIFDEIQELYFKSLKTCVYDNFLQLDKFKKAQYFTIKDLDIDTINIIYKGYLIDKTYYKALDMEKRKYIKQFGHNSYTLSDIERHYRNIAYNTALYVFQTTNSSGDFWYFQVGDETNPNRKAHKKYLPANDPLFDTYYPPNFLGDNSRVRATIKDFLKLDVTRNKGYDKFSNCIKLYAEDDFNFNIPKYFFENVLNRSEIDTIIQKIKKSDITLY